MSATASAVAEYLKRQQANGAADYPFAMSSRLPALNQPPVQLPQLTMGQIPAFLPNPVNYSPAATGMPFIRNRTLGNVLGPLTMPNYGLPSFDQSGQLGPMPMPIMNGGGLGFPGGQWGLQPISGGVG